MSTKSQVAALIAAGKTPAQASRELGVTEGYISQLKNDEEFLRMVVSIQKSAAQVGAHSLHQKIDGHYDSLEYKTISMLDANSDIILSQLIDKPASLLSFMRTLNGAKRRSVGEATAQKSAEQEYVAVVLPAFLTQATTPKVVHNSQNEVIEVDSRPLVSLSSSGLRGQLEQQLATKTPSAAAIARLEIDAEIAATTPAATIKSEEEQLDLFAGLKTQDPALLVAPVARPPMQVPKMKSNPVNLHSFAPPAAVSMAPLDLSSL